VTTPRTPDPDRGAAFLGKLLSEDPAHLDVATDEEVERMMDAAGIQVEDVPSAEELVARAEKRAAACVPASGVVRALEPARAPPPAAKSRIRRMSPAAIAAAVAAVAVGGVALSNGAAIVAYLKGETGPTVAASVAQHVATLRKEAFAACDARRWDECTRKLDEAKELDPAGESDERVVAARKAIAGGTQGK
jgi:hypothetical protein